MDYDEAYEDEFDVYWDYSEYEDTGIVDCGTVDFEGYGYEPATRWDVFVYRLRCRIEDIRWPIWRLRYRLGLTRCPDCKRFYRFADHSNCLPF